MRFIVFGKIGGKGADIASAKGSWKKESKADVIPPGWVRGRKDESRESQIKVEFVF